MGGSEDNVVDMPTKEKVESSGRNVSVCQSCGEVMGRQNLTNDTGAIPAQRGECVGN